MSASRWISQITASVRKHDASRLTPSDVGVHDQLLTARHSAFARPGPAALISFKPCENCGGLRSRLGGPCCNPAVAGSGHLDQGGWDTAQTQRGVILFALADRCPVIFRTDHHQCRGLHITDEGQRRQTPIGLRILPRLCADLIRAERGWIVSCKRLRGPVDNRLLRNGRLETVCLANNPAGQHTSAGASGDKQAIGICNA